MNIEVTLKYDQKAGSWIIADGVEVALLMNPHFVYKAVIDVGDNLPGRLGVGPPMIPSKARGRISHPISSTPMPRASDVNGSASSQITASFVTKPPLHLSPQWNREVSAFGAQVTLEAKFGGDMGKKGLYRQYVRGRFAVNGIVCEHPLYENRIMSQTEWQLDGKHGRAYGDRDWRDGSNVYYDESRLIASQQRPIAINSGCHYRMGDHPQIKGSPGDRLEMDLEFRGELVDPGGSVLDSCYWNVVGGFVVPEPSA